MSLTMNILWKVYQFIVDAAASLLSYFKIKGMKVEYFKVHPLSCLFRLGHLKATITIKQYSKQICSC